MTLRKVPLINSMSGEMPKGRPKLQLYPLHLPEQFKTPQHFPAWMNECDQLIDSIDRTKEQAKEWDQWYRETYLNKQPPGILDMELLLPKKR
ncbi:HBL237Cp [Eremothecium sinecaudum]|uniref:HBL237Cp n=1 Tax=Eremothecium sinecaudum TaxID=45286 RepID=A0A109UW76_9SACH|nr:HBL237Cp [Eremothecium sinecaudum]AMD18665.1 HBL237Cp [Eremothecium sinecaudum]